MNSSNSLSVWADVAVLTATTEDGAGNEITATATVAAPSVTTAEGTPGQNPYSAASGASTFVYTATASPVPTSGGDGLTLVGSGGAAVSTPTEPEWDATISQGTTKPCASLDPGVYVVMVSWSAAGADLAGAYAYVSPVDVTGVPVPDNGLQINSPNLVKSVVVVADVPVRLGAAAGANNDDATRTFDMHMWVTKIADFG